MPSGKFLAKLQQFKLLPFKEVSLMFCKILFPTNHSSAFILQ
jgi:hypothetical protein